MKKLFFAAFIVMLMACICIGGALLVQAEEGTGAVSGGATVETGGGSGGESDAGTSEETHAHNWTYDYDTNTATCDVSGCDIATCTSHVASTEWAQKVDGETTYHYHVCTTCGMEVDKANCSNELGEGGSAATCTKSAVCGACGNEYGEPTGHSIGDDPQWLQDEAKTYHYHACTACDVEVDKANCSYELGENGSAATCTESAVCGACGNAYGEPTGHSAGDDPQWVQDATKTYHYYACTACGEELEKTNCSNELGEGGSAATCTESAVCGACGNAYGEPMHRKDTELKQNAEEGYHYYSCIDCGEELDKEDCYGGTAADCTHLPECEICGQTYGEEYGAHTMQPTASRHEEDPDQYHVLTYPCCGREVEAEHTEGTAANCHSAAVCSVCKLQYGEIDPDHHDVSKATCSPLNATHHKVTCKCGVELDPAAHSGGAATCSKQAICVDCGAAYGTYNGVHSYDNDCDADCNDCGATRTPAEHVFGEWEVTKNPTETEEGEQKRVCTVCGETQTATVAVITNPNGSGEAEPDGIKTSTVVIIVAVVVVAAAAVAAIVILTKKKK